MRICLFVVLLSSLSAFSQDNELSRAQVDEVIEKNHYNSFLKTYAQQFPDEPVMIRNKSVNYKFEIGEESGKLRAVRTESKEYYTFSEQYFSIPFSVEQDENSKVNWVKIDGDTKDLNFQDVEVGGVFYHDVKRANFKFTLGRYRYGYITYGKNAISTSTSKTYEDARYISKELISDLYPTLYQEISFEIPEGVDINLKLFNFENEDFEKEEVQGKAGGKVITYKVYASQPFERKFNNQRGSFIYPHILIIPQSYTTNGNETKVFESLDDLYGWYRTLVSSIEQNKEVLKSTVHLLTKDLTNDEEKIKAIYFWVQDNIRYVAYEDGLAGFQPKPCEEVFMKRYGDCKGMANLLKEMLEIAGFDARLSWLGTTIIPYDYDVHCLASDNHMICTLIKGDNKFYLDATEKYAALGENAERIQGRQVLIEDGGNYILDSIPRSSVFENGISKKYDFTLEEMSLNGKVHFEYQGEGKRYFLNKMNNLKTQYKKRALENLVTGGSDNIVSSNIHTSDLQDRKKNIAVSADLKIQNQTLAFEDDIYLLQDLLRSNFGMGEIDSTRRFGYNFEVRGAYDVQLKVKIPKHVLVKNLPHSFTEDNEDFRFELFSKVEGNEISVTKKITLYDSVLDKDHIKVWNAAVERVDTELKKVIILKEKI